MAKHPSTGYMRIREQPANVHAGHPYVNKDTHEALLEYCKDRLEISRNMQSHLRDRFVEIDKEIYGYMQLTREDAARRVKQMQGRTTSPTEMRAAFALTQLLRMVTFFVSVYSPDSGIYEVVAPASQQTIGQALTQLMNKHATKGSYFREQAKFFLDTLKYNLGCFEADWFVETGKKLVDQGGKVKLEETTTFEGNKIMVKDMYNVFWEPNINPVDAYKLAEYAGYVDLCTIYQLKKQVQDGEIFNTKGVFRTPTDLTKTSGYYKSPPAVRVDLNTGINEGMTDWVHVLSMGQNSTTVVNLYERVTMYIRLIPTEFGLVPNTEKRTRNKFEIWRIRIINGSRIVECKHMPNVHDYIPLFFGSPMEDNMKNQAKSPGEMLAPFQQFANFMLNVHVKSARKNLYDLTVYDPQVVDLSQLDDDVAARIPMNPAGAGKDPRASIWRPDTSIDTSATMEQVTKLLELMEYIFPTRLMQQVGNIDRAVTDQISALLAAAYRDSWKFARLIDEQAMSPMRFVLVSNIKQFQTEMKFQSAQGEVDISPTMLRNTDFEFKVGEGLKMIDKLTVMGFVKELINSVLQSQSIAEFDIPAMLTWFSGLGNVEADFNQFRRAQPQMPGAPAGGGGSVSGNGVTAPPTAINGGTPQVQ